MQLKVILIANATFICDISTIERNPGLLLPILGIMRGGRVWQIDVKVTRLTCDDKQSVETGEAEIVWKSVIPNRDLVTWRWADLRVDIITIWLCHISCCMPRHHESPEPTISVGKIPPLVLYCAFANYLLLFSDLREKCFNLNSVWCKSWINVSIKSTLTWNCPFVSD